MKELEKTYNPADIEDRLYQKWPMQSADAETARSRSRL